MLNWSKLFLGAIILLGSVSAVRITLCITRFVKTNFFSLETKYKDYGSVELSKARAQRAWAVVTGASSGIGYEFALQLAKQGFNILAIARSDDKLASLSEEIKKVTDGKVTNEIYLFDLKTKDTEKWDKLYTKLESLPGDIGVLVNNAGVNQEYPEQFKIIDENVIQNIIDLNVTGTVKITKKILPLLLSPSDICKKRLILNVGSFAGIFPTPLLTTYSASKAFISTWSEALASELKNTNVHVEVITPLFISTEMSKIRKTNLLVPSPKTFVQSTLKRLGTFYFHSTYLPHSLVIYLLNLVPRNTLMEYIHSTNAKTNEIALMKLKKK